MTSDTSALEKLNTASDQAAWNELMRCCGASKWVLSVMNGRPFANPEALFAHSERAFQTLARIDWLEAFAHHTKIGDTESTPASKATLQALAQASNDYEDKFGFTFIICATDKSADEILAVLQIRLNNTAETELQNAAEQQQQITALRLKKLLGRPI